MAHYTSGYTADALHSRQRGSVQVSVEDPTFDLDNEIQGIRNQVRQLKDMSEAIGEESKQQKEIQDQLQETMEQAQAALRHGMRKLNHVYHHAQGNHVLMVLLYGVAFFFAMYLVMKVVHIAKFLGWR